MSKYYFDLLVVGVFNRVPSAARFSVVDSDYTSGAVNHPFVSTLKAVMAVARAYESHQIGFLEYDIVPPFPICRPSAFKPTIGRCRHKVDCRIGFPNPENNLCCPDVYTTSHAGDEGDEPVIHSLEDCCLQVFFLSAPLVYATSLGDVR